MTVGERIKKIRQDNAISQTDLANACKISKQTLYKYENNIITNIPSDKIESLAKIYNTTPAYLMGREDEKGNFLLDKNNPISQLSKKEKFECDRCNLLF